MLHTIKRKKADCIGHILRRNCLIKHFTEVKIEGRLEAMRRRGKRHKQLLDNLRRKRGY